MARPGSTSVAGDHGAGEPDLHGSHRPLPHSGVDVVLLGRRAVRGIESAGSCRRRCTVLLAKFPPASDKLPHTENTTGRTCPEHGHDPPVVVGEHHTASDSHRDHGTDGSLGRYHSSDSILRGLREQSSTTAPPPRVARSWARRDEARVGSLRVRRCCRRPCPRGARPSAWTTRARWSKGASPSRTVAGEVSMATNVAPWPVRGKTEGPPGGTIHVGVLGHPQALDGVIRPVARPPWPYGQGRRGASPSASAFAPRHAVRERFRRRLG